MLQSTNQVNNAKTHL